VARTLVPRLSTSAKLGLQPQPPQPSLSIFTSLTSMFRIRLIHFIFTIIYGKFVLHEYNPLRLFISSSIQSLFVESTSRDSSSQCTSWGWISGINTTRLLPEDQVALRSEALAHNSNVQRSPGTSTSLPVEFTRSEKSRAGARGKGCGIAAIL
jgi:hypothetical protein